MEEKFTSIKISTGETVDILCVKVGHIWRATFEAQSDQFYRWAPYLYPQILLFNGKKKTQDEIGEMDLEDFNMICEVISASLTPFK